VDKPAEIYPLLSKVPKLRSLYLNGLTPAEGGLLNLLGDQKQQHGRLHEWHHVHLRYCSVVKDGLDEDLRFVTHEEISEFLDLQPQLKSFGLVVEFGTQYEEAQTKILPLNIKLKSNQPHPSLQSLVVQVGYRSVDIHGLWTCIEQFPELKELVVARHYRWKPDTKQSRQQRQCSTQDLEKLAQIWPTKLGFRMPYVNDTLWEIDYVHCQPFAELIDNEHEASENGYGGRHLSLYFDAAEMTEEETDKYVARFVAFKQEQYQKDQKRNLSMPAAFGTTKTITQANTLYVWTQEVLVTTTVPQATMMMMDREHDLHENERWRTQHLMMSDHQQLPYLDKNFASVPKANRPLTAAARVLSSVF